MDPNPFQLDRNPFQMDPNPFQWTPIHHVQGACLLKAVPKLRIRLLPAFSWGGRRSRQHACSM
eukprot:7927172-Heterocapsa_arctica.AAC.1